MPCLFTFMIFCCGVSLSFSTFLVTLDRSANGFGSFLRVQALHTSYTS